MLKRISSVLLSAINDNQAGFDAAFYSAYYPDLSKLKSKSALRSHYAIYGLREGRLKNQEEAIRFSEAKFDPLPEDFDIEGYRLFNGDLVAQFAYDWQLKLHYIEYGRKERRKYKRADATQYQYTYELLDPNGVVPGRRPTDETDFALEVPFHFNAGFAHTRSIAALVHCFYPDVLSPILARLENIPTAVDLYISTNTEQKRAEIVELTASWRRGKLKFVSSPIVDETLLRNSSAFGTSIPTTTCSCICTPRSRRTAATFSADGAITFSITFWARPRSLAQF